MRVSGSAACRTCEPQSPGGASARLPGAARAHPLALRLPAACQPPCPAADAAAELPAGCCSVTSQDPLETCLPSERAGAVSTSMRVEVINGRLLGVSESNLGSRQVHGSSAVVVSAVGHRCACLQALSTTEGVQMLRHSRGTGDSSLSTQLQSAPLVLPHWRHNVQPLHRGEGPNFAGKISRCDSNSRHLQPGAGRTH